MKTLRAEVDSLKTALAATQASLNQQGLALAAAQSTLSQLQTDLASGVAGAKTYCDGKVAPVADKLIHFSRSGNEVYISGANLNIRNGKGSTYNAGVNGLGNLILGYNELRGEDDVRTGSHNVVLGFGQNYTSAGAFMSGAHNNSNGYFASVIGGTGNTASGLYAVVVGGYNNAASGNWSTILGGQNVTAASQLDHKP